MDHPHYRERFNISGSILGSYATGRNPMDPKKTPPRSRAALLDTLATNGLILEACSLISSGPGRKRPGPGFFPFVVPRRMGRVLPSRVGLALTSTSSKRHNGHRTFFRRAGVFSVPGLLVNKSRFSGKGETPPRVRCDHGASSAQRVVADRKGTVVRVDFRVVLEPQAVSGM